MIRAMALQAVILDCQRKTGQALNAFENSLAVFELGRFLCTFLDLGALLMQFLVRAIAKGISTSYNQRLLEAFQHQEQPQFTKVGSDRMHLEETLSEYELPVLHLLPTNLTRIQTSEQLSIPRILSAQP